MPQITDPNTIKMLEALAAKQSGQTEQPAQPVMRGAPKPVIAAPPPAPEKPDETFRTLTPDEVAAQGLEPGGVYQISNTTGKITQTQAPAKEDAAEKPYSQSALDAFDRAINTIDRLKSHPGLPAAVGSAFDPAAIGSYNPITGEYFGGTQAKDFAAELDALKAQVFLPMVQSMKGLGAFSNAEGEKLTAAIGALDPGMSEAAFKSSIERIKADLLAYRNRGLPPEQQKTAGGETPTGTGLRVAEGAEYSTDTDIALARRLSEAWQSGAPIEQLNAISVEVTGSPLSQQALDTLATDPDRRLSFTPARSGKREGGAPGAAAAIGAGLLKGYTGNLAEEAVGLISPDAAAKLQAAGEYAQEQAPVTSFVSELVGGAVSPLARLPLGKAGTVAGEAMRGAAYGGLYGAGEAAPGASISDRVTGAAIGATTGGAGGALAGRFMQPRASGGSGAPSSVAGDVAAAEQAGIPVLTSDVSPPSTFIGRSVQQVGERIPLAGTSGVRASQQEARVKAVQDVLTEYTTLAPETLPENIVSDLVAKRGGELSRYSKLKGEVIERLSDKGQVPLPRTMTVIDEQIAELSRRGTPAANEAIAELQNIRQTLQGRDLYGLEAYRADELANVFKDEGKFSVAAREVGEKALRKIYDPVRQDMRQFISEVGEPRDVTKWTVANKRLQALAGETQKQALKTVLRKGDATPELVENMLFSGKRSDVAALYRGLTPEGRATARAAIINRIFRNLGGDIENVSPERFVNEVRKQGNSIGVFFGGEDAAKINGLVRALKLTGRASQAPVLTASGQQLYVPFAVTGFVDAFGTGGAATAGAMTLGLMARAYESKPMRNLLLAMSKAKAGSEAESKIAAKIKEKLASAVKTASGQTGANAAPEPQTIQLEARQ